MSYIRSQARDFLNTLTATAIFRNIFVEANYELIRRHAYYNYVFGSFFKYIFCSCKPVLIFILFPEAIYRY